MGQYSERYESKADESAYKRVGTLQGNFSHRVTFWGGEYTGEGVDAIVTKEPRKDWRLVTGYRVEILDSEQNAGYGFRSDTNRLGFKGYIVENVKLGVQKLVGRDGLEIAIAAGWCKVPASIGKISNAVMDAQTVHNFANVGSRNQV